MKKAYANVLRTVIAVFVASYLILQVYNSVYNPFSTETATSYSTYDGISITGISIRSENVLTQPQDGIKSFVAQSGQRVAKNGVIANIYSNAGTAANVGRITEIDEQIANLTELQNYSNSSAASLNFLETQISDSYLKIMASARGSDFPKIASLSDELLTLLNRKQIATGQASDFASLIASLNSERTSLVASGTAPSSTVVTPNSGYFIAETDGFESVLTPDSVEDITPETLDSATPVTTSSVGKVVGDYEWYIAAVISKDDAAKFAEDDSITLKTSLNTMAELPVTVAKLNKSADGEKYAIVFKCKYMNSELASIRTQPFTAVMNSYSGLRINSKAVRIVDGQRGVYVVSGAVAKFKTVDIIYSSGGYSICRLSSDSNSLSLYDEVIVKGKNLSDGKIIK